jgi:hypothetical protein
MMARPHADDELQAEATPAELLDDEQTAIAEQLTTISNLAPLITALTDSRQRGLGFLTWEGKQIQDAMIRKDREDLDQRIRTARATGRLPKDGFIVGRGESPSPGNIVAISVEATFHFALHDQVRRLLRGLATQGVCSLTRIPEDADVPDLVAALRALIWQSTDMGHLQAVHRDLEHLVEEARRLIDGNDRTLLGTECPHCDRRTLVVYFADDLIRCDRDPKTGRYEPCTCNDPTCSCKTRPQAFRHEWHRTKKPHTWQALSDRFNFTREAGTADPGKDTS